MIEHEKCDEVASDEPLRVARVSVPLLIGHLPRLLRVKRRKKETIYQVPG